MQSILSGTSSLTSNMPTNIMGDAESFNVILDATHSIMALRLAEIKFDKRWNIA